MQKNAELYYYAEVVHRWTGVTLREMQTQDRRPHIVEARCCLMYLLRYRAKMTLMDIAKLLRRHYTTIHHGLETIYTLRVTMKKYTWLKEIKHYEPHNIMPKNTMYICDKCGSKGYHNKPVHLGQAAADCAPAGNA